MICFNIVLHFVFKPDPTFRRRTVEQFTVVRKPINALMIVRIVVEHEIGKENVNLI